MGSNQTVSDEALVCLVMHLKAAGVSMAKVYKDMAKADPSRTESSFEHQVCENEGDLGS